MKTLWMCVFKFISFWNKTATFITNKHCRLQTQNLESKTWSSPLRNSSKMKLFGQPKYFFVSRGNICDYWPVCNMQSEFILWKWVTKIKINTLETIYIEMLGERRMSRITQKLHNQMILEMVQEKIKTRQQTLNS